jgi:predicted nucleotidyltransferase
MKATLDIDGVLARRLAPFRPVVVYLFGSAANGRARPDSDVDIAFLAASPPDEESFHAR